ncbi:tRNA-splicing endonuclease subunit [Dissophora globulifera]|nr:tRNA-splicing endonuclease subunit [Dissophora globulifera]
MAANAAQAPNSPQRKPRIYLAGHEALVWDVQDIRRLRQEYRIVGSLTGSLPRSPMQNVFQGLPLRLLPEEVYALWSSALVDVVVEDDRAYLPSPLAPSEALQESTAIAVTSAARPHDHIHLYTRSSSLPHYSMALSPETTAMPTGASIPRWDHSIASRQQQRSAIFKHLWATKRFFMASGIKFGGDYLLYRNDPLVCHASLIATVVDTDKSLSLADLACSARLASTVQKQHLICAQIKAQSQRRASSASAEMPPPNEDHGSGIVLFLIEWAGF